MGAVPRAGARWTLNDTGPWGAAADEGESVYRTLTQAHWLAFFGLPREAVPTTLILEGTINYRDWERRMTTALDEARPTRVPNLWLGRYGRLPVAVSWAYGPTMAADVAHVFAALGGRLLIQTGSFGGLRPGQALGDLLLPTQAAREDGVSGLFLSNGQPATASPELLTWAVAECRQRGIPAHSGPMVTTRSLAAETPADITRWHAAGYYGVDLETATTFAVAQTHGLRRLALLRLVDNLIDGDHLLVPRDADQQALNERRREEIMALALGAAVAWAEHERAVSDDGVLVRD